ncbi:phosphoserine phosphatase [Sporolactobacillus inulinus]|nr:HAD hydrolase-like protein [Sporolactobacillus inulinus]GAY77102.1 phosphoserine phosphatase [Sporolactobacillus inulinus]
MIVGDSLADLLCAKQLGCRFAGVLTGLSGQAARSELETHGADFILDSVADVKDLVLGLLEK